MSEIRDFDAESAARPLSQFIAAGETFTLRRSVRPETLIEWGELDESEAPPQESLRVMDSLMKSLLIPDDADRWDAARKIEGEQEIGLDKILGIVKYSIEQVSGRPTGAPSSSGPGRNGIGTPSTDDSPQRGLISTPSPSDDSST